MNDIKPEPNVELFLDVLAQIEKHPETWNQADWRCGSGMCFAGWASDLAGFVWRNDWSEDGVVFGRDGVPAHCSVAAADALGVEPYTHDDYLFAAGNRLGDLYRISAELIGVDETVLRDKVADRVADGAVL